MVSQKLLHRWSPWHLHTGSSELATLLAAQRDAVLNEVTTAWQKANLSIAPLVTGIGTHSFKR